MTNTNNISSRHLGIPSELRSLQETEMLNPNDDEESCCKFLSSFDWKDSMLQQHEIKKIESLFVEFHDIFARHRFDIGIKEEFTVKLTQRMTHQHRAKACQPRLS